MQDEGVAPRVAQELISRYNFPENVEVLDRGTMGMSLLSDLKRFDVILYIDAVDGTGMSPGTVVSYLPEEIAPYETFHGAHDTRFVDILEAAFLLGYNPDGQCLGVQVQNINPTNYTIGLTPPVEASLPALIQYVLKFLKKHNVEVSEKAVGA